MWTIWRQTLIKGELYYFSFDAYSTGMHLIDHQLSIRWQYLCLCDDSLSTIPFKSASSDMKAVCNYLHCAVRHLTCHRKNCTRCYLPRLALDAIFWIILYIYDIIYFIILALVFLRPWALQCNYRWMWVVYSGTHTFPHKIINDTCSTQGRWIT